MKTLALVLASAGALLLSSCACHKTGSCCAAGADAAATKSCCKDGKVCKDCTAAAGTAKKKA